LRFGEIKPWLHDAHTLTRGFVHGTGLRNNAATKPQNKMKNTKTKGRENEKGKRLGFFVGGSPPSIFILASQPSKHVSVITCIACEVGGCAIKDWAHSILRLS